MKGIDNKAVAAVFSGYPPEYKTRLMYLRELIFDTAVKSPEIEFPEETLKWGEPSYVTKKGSTVRLAWKARKPDQYGMYFQCQTTLVETFRELYFDQLTFEGNRAIVFGREDRVPEDVIRHCILLSLTYHRVKHLPMLGA